jgi:PAS domain S-box-containing protein
MLENQRPEQVLAALLETAGDAILGIALDGSIFLWSQGAEHLYGYTTAELAGRSLTRLLPLYDVPARKTLLLAAREGRIGIYDTAERLRKDNSRVSVAVRRRALRDADGNVVGIRPVGGGPSSIRLKY